MFCTTVYKSLRTQESRTGYYQRRPNGPSLFVPRETESLPPDDTTIYIQATEQTVLMRYTLMQH